MKRPLIVLWLACAVACGSSGGSSAAPHQTLTVATAGSGTGSVNSTPTGVSCGTSCTADFDQGTTVALVAAPGPLSAFAGWSGGGCGGAGSCVVAMSAAQTVTATFVTAVTTTWDPAWSVPGVTFSSGSLSISGDSPGTKEVRTVSGKDYGKYYWEVAATAGDGVTDQGGLGIAEAAMPNTAPYIGDVPSGLSFGYGGYPEYWITWAGATLSGTPPPASSYVRTGITYMFALDMDAGSFWAGQDGSWYGGGDPTTGANPVATGLTGTVYPAVTFYDSSGLAFTANFGASAFAYGAPSGFSLGFF